MHLCGLFRCLNCRVCCSSTLWDCDALNFMLFNLSHLLPHDHTGGLEPSSLPLQAPTQSLLLLGLPPPTPFPAPAISLTNLTALPFHLRGIFFLCQIHRLHLPRVCQLPQRLGICRDELIKLFLLFILKLVLPAGLFDCHVCPGPKQVAFPGWLLSPQTCSSVPTWEGPSSSLSGGKLTFGHPHLAFCDFP